MSRIVPVLALLTLLPRAAASDPTYAFATATDFQSPVGCASWVGIAPPRTPHDCVEDVSSDPVARWAFDQIYVVNRFGADNIQILDPSSNFQTVRQFSTGNGTNPQDIAVLTPQKAYVSLYNAPYLLVVNPEAGAVTDSIPLGQFADADGVPEAARMWFTGTGDRVFVALQRQNSFVPDDTAYVAVIDGVADTVLDADATQDGVQAIKLVGRNPISDLEYDFTRNRLLVCSVGDFGVLDGGVEAIDVNTLEALGYETTEAALGGQLGDVAVSASGRAYVSLSDLSFEGASWIERYDRDTGAPRHTLYSTENFALGDLETNTLGELWACDRTLLSPGLRVYNTTDDAALAGPISTGVPPFDVLFDGSVTVSAKTTPRSSLAILSAGPNPTRGEWRLQFSVGEGAPAPARLQVFDVRGALVDGVALGPVGPGQHSISWRARPGLAAGSYYFRLERAGEARSGSMVLLR
jgi:hypothetical protein